MLGSKRLLANTTVTYCSSVFGMALGLFSSRWVLEGLGQVDYGLMGVVGALIVFIAFLNNVLAGASSRFFAYAIGEGLEGETKKWFNTCLFLHIALPLVLISFGWPIGEWAVDHFLTIPDERLPTAHWVFRLSLLSGFLNMGFAPFKGMFIAKQDIVEIALWGVVGSISNFMLAYAVLQYSGDNWLLYSFGSVLISSSLILMQIGRAYTNYEECRIQFKLWFDWPRLRKLLNFSGWSLFGAVGSLLRGQGIAILLNKYFNPASFPGVNASYAIGMTVSSYTQTLSTALLGAFTPEITSSEGRGDRTRMLLQANRASKFGTYLVLLFAIPLILEINYVLNLWLAEPPEFAAQMASLILCTFIIDRLTAGHMLAVSARGKIAGYQIMLGGFLLLTLPVAWMFLKFELGAVSVCWAYVITMTLCSVGRLFWAKRLVGLIPLEWFKGVLCPLILLAASSVLAGLICRSYLNPSVLRLGLVIGTTLILNVSGGWLLLLNTSERSSLWSILEGVAMRFFRIRQK